MRFECGMVALYQAEATFEAFPGVSIDDVFLYPNGMAAIWNWHTLLTATIGSKFDLDTLKIAHIK